MPRAPRSCSHPAGCVDVATHGSRCAAHARQADKARGTATERGYTGPGHRSFREAVLTRDPVCVVCKVALSTVADHHPTSRRDLVEQGLDPDDPKHGRGCCKRCHDRETAKHQPGGWNAGNYQSPSD